MSRLTIRKQLEKTIMNEYRKYYLYDYIGNITTDAILNHCDNVDDLSPRDMFNDITRGSYDFIVCKIPFRIQIEFMNNIMFVNIFINEDDTDKLRGVFHYEFNINDKNSKTMNDMSFMTESKYILPSNNNVVKMIEELCKEYDSIAHEIFNIEKICIEESCVIDKWDKLSPVEHAVDILTHDIGTIIAGEHISETINFEDFMKLEIDDVNYNHKIYRCVDPDLLERIIDEKFKTEWMLGRSYRVRNVRINKLFYVENCDVQDVSQTYGDDIMTLIKDNFSIIDIIKPNGENV